MSWISSLLTPSGTSAANNQSSRTGKVASTYGDLFNQAAPLNKDWLNTLGSAHLGNVFSGALNNINADPQSSIRRFGAGATEGAANNANQLSLQLKAMGFNDGAIQGATQGLFQDAARQTNAYAQQQYSPEEQQKKLLALLQAISGGSNLFGGLLNQYGQGVYGQPQRQVGQSPLGGIAQLAGLFL